MKKNGNNSTGSRKKRDSIRKSLYFVAIVIGVIAMSWTWAAISNETSQEPAGLAKADANPVEVNLNKADTLHLRENLSTYTQALGHKFSFVYPVIDGYNKLDVGTGNCSVTEIYYDQNTGLQYLLFNFDNTGTPDDTTIDFNISYNTGKLMADRAIKLPAYQPFSAETVAKKYTVKGQPFKKLINATVPDGEIVTDDSQLDSFAQNITSVEDLSKKLNEHFKELNIVCKTGNVGYEGVSNDKSGTKSDSETFANGGDCLDLAYLFASIAKKANIAGLAGADVVAGYINENPHAITQLELNGNLHYIDATLMNYLAENNMAYYVDPDFVPFVNEQYIYGEGATVYQDVCKKCNAVLPFSPFSFNDCTVTSE